MTRPLPSYFGAAPTPARLAALSRRLEAGLRRLDRRADDVSRVFGYGDGLRSLPPVYLPLVLFLAVLITLTGTQRLLRSCLAQPGRASRASRSATPGSAARTASGPASTADTSEHRGTQPACQSATAASAEAVPPTVQAAGPRPTTPRATEVDGAALASVDPPPRLPNPNSRKARFQPAFKHAQLVTMS